MPTRLTSDRQWSHFGHRENWWSGHWREIDIAIKFVVAVAVASFSPLPLFLPVLSMMLLIIGFGTAGSALLRGDTRESPLVTRWDEAGLLVFAGFAAVIVCDPTDALRYLDQLEMRR